MTKDHFQFSTGLIYSTAVPYGVEGAGWLGLEVADRTMENVQNWLDVKDNNEKTNAPKPRKDDSVEQRNPDERDKVKADLKMQEGEMYYTPLSFSQNMRFDYNLSEREIAPQNETSSSEEYVPYPLRIDNER